MNNEINEVVTLINNELTNRSFSIDTREHLIKIYQANGEIVKAFYDENYESIGLEIGNIFLLLTIICKQYDVNFFDLEWDDEGLDTDNSYSAFYKEMMLLNGGIGSLSNELYTSIFVDISVDISNDIEGILEKLANVSKTCEITLSKVAYHAYQNFKKSY